MTTLQEAATATTFATRLVDRVSRGLGRFGRRGFLVQTAVVGSALAVDPKGYVLTPQTAASTVCGPASSCSEGYTVMCCTINNGVNGCPPGTFAAGWWKAADSSWCGGGYRYIVDCNASCSKCTSGCSGDNICSSGCWSCGCKCGSSATCDQRRVCCNAFRYGQCNTQVRCSGGVACRVVSCIAPYKWANCTTTSLTDNATAEHSAPCLPRWSPVAVRYNALGGEGSSLGVSIGPEHLVGDGRGRYVNYQHGSIYWSSASGGHRVAGGIRARFLQLSGPRGVLGYPTGEMARAADGKGYLQYFEKGMLVDGPGLPVVRVSGGIRSAWLHWGGVTGLLGYPTADMVRAKDGKGYLQEFQKGTLVDGPGLPVLRVTGGIRTAWLRWGRETGALGYPTDEMSRTTSGDGYQQDFQKATLVDGPDQPVLRVAGGIRAHWDALGRDGGVAGYPVAEMQAAADPGGYKQRFTGGIIVDGPSTSTFIVRGRVLDAWLAAKAEAGSWGYPLEDTVVETDGSQHQRFQGGVLSA
ncbi:MAG: LGFP repeat-containing protein [Angustibacter sp.]